MFERRQRIWGWFALIAAVGAACGQSKSSDDDDGGDSGQAGEPAGTSGKSGGAGGRANSGGRTSGGVGARGGTAATSGSDAAGGAPENGGVAGLGGEGAETSGGTDSAGGADTGGTGATGGDAASGGDAAGSVGGASGATGSGACGDAYRDPSDECDDGNHVNGDGCHSDCTVEAGFVCYSATCDDDGCSLPIPAVFRDFNSGLGGHPDFQPGFNSGGAVQGLLEPLLDDEGKPVLASGWSVSESFIHSKASFAEWYRDDAPSGGPIAGQIVLWDDGTGRYVNRWGKSGEKWPVDAGNLSYDPIVYGGPGGTGCEACVPSSTGTCYDPCVAWPGSTQACCAEIPTFIDVDGSPLFFPIDEGTGLLSEPRSEGKVPQEYGWPGYPWETAVAASLGVTTPIETAHAPFPSTTHNFSFTSEVKAWFRYESDQPRWIEVGGDDDIWLFINGRLAVDLGAWHTPLEGTVTISGGVVTSSAVLDYTGATVTGSSTVETFGLVDGNVYAVAVFHAERQKEASSFKLALQGTDLKRSVCVPEP
jgi:fibro-slime domain-containing protein